MINLPEPTKRAYREREGVKQEMRRKTNEKSSQLSTATHQPPDKLPQLAVDSDEERPDHPKSDRA